MLQRSLLRASCQAARPLSRPQPLLAAARQQGAARWYSEQPAAKEGAASENKAAEQPSDEASKLKAQVEKQERDIIDLKVRTLAAAMREKNQT